MGIKQKLSKLFFELYEKEQIEGEAKKEAHVKKWIHNYFNPENSMKFSAHGK